MRIPAVAIAAAALFAAGCSKVEVAPTGPISAGPPPPSMGVRTGGAPPGMDPSTIPGHPPVGGNPHPGMPGAGMPGGMAPPPAAAGLPASHFPSPKGWQEEKPSTMRLLQFRLPRADGDDRDGEVAVFTNIMGSAEANLERWRGQFSEVIQGKDRVEEFTEGMKGKVSLLDISGNFGGGMGPMAGAHGADVKPTATRMLGAVVEHPGGTFYVKVWGPPATMGKWEESIRAFILDAAKK